MDHQRFDAAVRALGRQVTRRRGLAAAAGVLFATAGHVAGAARKPARGQRKQQPGPCGDGSPKANSCARAKSCCTKYCVEGVCHCKPNYMICQRDAHCCSGRCVNGRCDGGCGRGRVPCDENFNCCDGFVCSRGVCKRGRTGSCDPSNCSGCCQGTVCRSGTDPLACGPAKGICAACGANEVCSGGACVPGPESCRATCSGCCAFGACLPGNTAGGCGRDGAYCAACGGSNPVCIDGVCTGCGSHGDCPPAAPFCSANACVACRNVADCPATAADACTAAGCRCGAGAVCSGSTPICSGGACVGCVSNGDCSGNTPVCSGGACVGCSSNTDCSGATPRCCSGACVAPAWANQALFGGFGSGQDELDSPESVAVAADLLAAYVADRKNCRVAIWTRPNASSTNWSNPGFIGSGPGAGDTQFSAPFGVALSADGAMLFVADRGNNRISVWVRAGSSWSHSLNFGAGSLSQPQSIAVNGAGSIAWVTEPSVNRVAVWSNAGGSWVQQAVFGSSSDLDGPYGVAAASDAQSVLIAQIGLLASAVDGRLSMWEVSGSAWGPEATFGPEGNASDEFFRPRGVSVSADGLTAWIADTGNNRVSIWTRQNANDTLWSNKDVFGRHGTGTDRLSGPSGLAVAGDGQTIWVADTGNNRVSVWAEGCPAPPP